MWLVPILPFTSGGITVLLSPIAAKFVKRSGEGGSGSCPGNEKRGLWLLTWRSGEIAIVAGTSSLGAIAFVSLGVSSVLSSGLAKRLVSIMSSAKARQLHRATAANPR